MCIDAIAASCPSVNVVWRQLLRQSPRRKNEDADPDLRHEQHDVRREAPVVLVATIRCPRHPAGPDNDSSPWPWAWYQNVRPPDASGAGDTL